MVVHQGFSELGETDDITYFRWSQVYNSPYLALDFGVLSAFALAEQIATRRGLSYPLRELRLHIDRQSMVRI
ncbi:hypothetical protein F4X90_15480 [Candidatus Poribacteria bacterium]|nr:hypothetical protein [Candidatus Poribacteria bacterium]